jgi:UDP-glucose 4-epimerase
VKIAVTGASGKVGSRIGQDLLQSGHEVVRIDRAETPSGNRSSSNHCVADLASFAATIDALRGAECVVHLAALGSPQVAPEWQVHNNNVVSSFNVLSAAAELGIARVVQASSVNAVGLAWSSKPNFAYFPLDLAHPCRPDDGYSLSKYIQEIQADSMCRRHPLLSVVSLRLHAVLADAAESIEMVDLLGEGWAINGLFGYCTFSSVSSAIQSALTAPVSGHEVLWVSESETFMKEPSQELAGRYFPSVPLATPLTGRQAFFDISRTREVLSWSPSTENNPPGRLLTL